MNAAVDVQDKRALEEAQGYLELNLPKIALQSLDRVGAVGRATFDWNLLRANTLIALDDCQGALGPLLAAKSQNAKAVPVFLSLGWCYKRTGQMNRAIAALQTAEQLCHSRPDAESHALVMYNLSCYYSLAGRKSDMLHWLDKALKAGSKYRKSLNTETDFDRFRQDDDFQARLKAVAG